MLTRMKSLRDKIDCIKIQETTEVKAKEPKAAEPKGRASKSKKSKKK